MVAPNLNFSLPEYQARLTKTRAAMAAAGVDTLLTSDPSNMNWLTGYDGWSFYVHQGVLLGMEGDPIWWGRGIDAAGARRTAWLPDDNIAGYDDRFVQATDCHPMEDLATLLKGRGWHNGVLGVEMDNYWYTAKAHAVLAQSLPNATLKDATGLVNWQRLIKSDQEIAYIRRAARIVEAMHARIVELIEPGLAKNELVAEILATATRGADGHWGDYAAFAPMVPGGMDATAPHLTWDDSPYRDGESAFFEIGGCHKRYHCPQSRTVFLGTPPQKYLDAEKAVLEATEIGLAMAKPGVTCGEMADAFFDALGERGFVKDNRTGYSIGLSYPPDWGERTISLRRGDDTPLQPGMTIHFMPALWLDDGAIEITETVLITESGHECLCDTPREMVVKG
ncbi:MAG: M24 family metallopeptidase [Pseudomonadota bacterium]